MNVVFRYKEQLLVTFLVLIAFVVRLYKINNPVADWHSWRQADTASVTHEYVMRGIDLLHPRYHDLSNIPSGKDNLEGWRMVEFPMVNALTAFIIRSANLVKQEVVVGRIVSIVFSFITLLCIYLLGKRISGVRVGFFAALLFAILPFSVYYSRVILPEPALLAFVTLSLVGFHEWIFSEKNIWFLVSLIPFALALLLKPFAIFYAPMFLGILIMRRQKFLLNVAKTGTLFILAAIPFLLWRSWIAQFPSGIPASDWLFNNNNIRFSGAFFHWLFEVRISTMILGIGGLVFAVLGLMKKGRDWVVYALGAFGMFAYLSIIAGGNVQHDYYQVFLLPFLVLTMARGVEFFIELTPKFISPLALLPTIGGLVGFSLFVSWYNIRGYYNINHPELMMAGEAVDRLLPKDAKIIAPYMGDTAFLFQTRRTGWPIGFSIDEKIKLGAQYYVTVNYDDEANALLKQYPVVEKNDRFLILKLQGN